VQQRIGRWSQLNHETIDVTGSATEGNSNTTTDDDFWFQAIRNGVVEKPIEPWDRWFD
jgi:hypothetical protein